MPNKLTGSASPYLLQHADNPVNWYPWGEEALQKAVEDNKPIFLSIGYAACHWCHVMAHESFEDPETADIMNSFFINIKVDREERPDIDNIYMTAVVALTGQGGWPLSVFLTPDQQPFYGGTYFPPVPRYNMPAFQDVLLGIAKTWKEEKDRLLDSGTKISEYIRKNQTVPGKSSKLSAEFLDKAAETLYRNYDWQHGGWGTAPKFPQPLAIEFLLRRASRGDRQSLDIATHALHSMAKGGMYDLIGGGFARYSTDNDWLVPHFEKMLYDNAQLARAYLHAYLITDEPEFRRVCIEVLDFVKREMTHSAGGFFSSLDADSEGEEGKFYTWTEKEIREAIKDKFEADFVLAAYGFTEKGNFEGKTVPRRVFDDNQLASEFNITKDEVLRLLRKINNHLLQAREKRIRPGTDDKVLVSWNAWMCVVFSEVGRYLRDFRCVEMATRNLNFITSDLLEGNRLFRAWRAGASNHAAYLEDYASLTLALLAHYNTNPDLKWFKYALQLSDALIEHFYSPEEELFYDTPNFHEALLIRPRDLQDNATPSGNALAAYALLQIAAYQGDGKLRDIAEKMLEKMQFAAVEYPTAFCNWLCAIDFALYPIREVAIIGDLQDSRTTELIDYLWSGYRPDVIAAISPTPSPVGGPALLKDRPLLNDSPTAYVCQGLFCQQPVNDVSDFESQLSI